MNPPDQTEPGRDRWGRPLVEMPDGRVEACKRASSISGFLDDKSGLIPWGQTNALRGIVLQPHLRAALSAIKPDDDKGLKALAKRSAEAGKSSEGADLGTAIHAACEDIALGRDTSGYPSDILADAQAALDALDEAGYEVLATESFVASPELAVAGTFDLLLRSPNGTVMIGDFKSYGAGKKYDVASYSALAWAVQLGVYANSTPYCSEAGWQDWQDFGGVPSRTGAVVVHIERGSAKAALYGVDISKGYKYAVLALEIADARKVGKTLARAF